LSEIQSSANTENLNINLQTGRIRVDVKTPAGTKASTKVRSPSAAASVCGTVFDYRYKKPCRILRLRSMSGLDGIMVSVNSGAANKIDAESKTVSPVDVIKSGVLPSSPVGTTAAPS